MTGNVLHDQLEWGYALHSDDGASYITYSKNVTYNDTHEWGTNHINYQPDRSSKYDPVRVVNNYWQQGDPVTLGHGLIEKYNTLIPGAAEAPSSIIQAS